MAVLAPMPRPRVRTTTREKAGVRVSVRIAYRTSCESVDMAGDIANVMPDRLAAYLVDSLWFRRMSRSVPATGVTGCGTVPPDLVAPDYDRRVSFTTRRPGAR